MVDFAMSRDFPTLEEFARKHRRRQAIDREALLEIFYRGTDGTVTLTEDQRSFIIDLVKNAPQP